MKPVASKIKDRRQELGLTLEDLAAACGVTITTVHRWETGLTPSIKTAHLAPLAEILQVPASWLLDGQNSPLEKSGPARSPFVESFSKSISSKIKRRRLELGLTLQDVGDACGVSKSTIKRWEDGHADSIKTSKLELLAKVLRTSVNDLLSFKGFEDEISEPTHALNCSYSVIDLEPVPSVACEAVIGPCVMATLIVKSPDDSMLLSKIYKDDFVYINRELAIKTGDIVLAQVGQDFYIRRLVRYQSGLELRADSPSFKTLAFDNDQLKDVNIIGLAVASLSELGRA